MIKNCICIIALFLYGLKLFSQSDCNNIIENASDLYHSGRYEECVQLLENGLKNCYLSKNKKESAYILLINSNIEKDSTQAVDKYFRLLLLNNPAFKIKDYDGIDDFKNNYRNYYIYPKWAIGIRPHYCIMNIFAHKTYSVMPDAAAGEYKVSKSVNTNLTLDYRLMEKWAQFMEIGYFNVNYNREIQNTYWHLKCREKTSYFQWDIGSKYFFNAQEKFNFYISSGMSNWFLKKSDLTLLVTEKKTDNPYDSGTDAYEEVTDGGEFDLKKEKQRNPYIAALLWGTGLVYRSGNIGYGIDTRYYWSINTLNNPSKRTENGDLIKKFAYLDDNFRMSKWNVSVTITYMFNKVKSKKTVH